MTTIIKNIKNNIINYELYTIYLLQKYISPQYIFIFVNLNKKLTSLYAIEVYLFIALLHDIYLCYYMIISLYISRNLNNFIKDYFKKKRPYNRNPLYIKYYNKRKDSYSFPSQSILNICIIYNTLYYYKDYNIYSLYISYFYYTLFISLSITRLYRGLHYPHDIIISYVYSIWIIKFILYLL